MRKGSVFYNLLNFRDNNVVFLLIPMHIVKPGGRV